MKLRTFIINVALEVLVASGLIHLKAVKAETPIVFPSFLLVQSQTDFGENFGKDFGEDFAVSSGKLLAVRADGSHAEFLQREDPRRPSQGNYFFLKSISDFATGKKTLIYDPVAATSTIALHDDGKYPFRVKPAATCQGVPDGSILGYAVTRDDHQELPPETDGFSPKPIRITESRWFAPALGCSVLKSTFIEEKFVSGVWILEVQSDITTTKVRIGSVDSYFAIPPGYQEMSFGQTYDLRHSKFPAFYPLLPPERRASMDKEYYGNQP
ncbi:MAG: hypothetical protein WB723_18565 [Candidatus Acidiferrales bacterium]